MKRKITTKDNIYLALPFVIMFILYRSSSMTYETQSIVPTLSNLLESEPFKNLLSKISFQYDEQLISIDAIGYFSFIEFFIRKGAHFFSFFFMGFFWKLGLNKRVDGDWLSIMLSIMLCIGYAALDEFRQVFNPERTGIMVDVILDTAGAVTGVLTSYILIIKKIIK